jgi:hypothetical protein
MAVQVSGGGWDAARAVQHMQQAGLWMLLYVVPQLQRGMKTLTCQLAP